MHSLTQKGAGLGRRRQARPSDPHNHRTAAYLLRLSFASVLGMCSSRHDGQKYESTSWLTHRAHRRCTQWRHQYSECTGMYSPHEQRSVTDTSGVHGGDAMAGEASRSTRLTRPVSPSTPAWPSSQHYSRGVPTRLFSMHSNLSGSLGTHRPLGLYV